MDLQFELSKHLPPRRFRMADDFDRLCEVLEDQLAEAAVAKAWPEGNRVVNDNENAVTPGNDPPRQWFQESKDWPRDNDDVISTPRQFDTLLRCLRHGHELSNPAQILASDGPHRTGVHATTSERFDERCFVVFQCSVEWIANQDRPHRYRRTKRRGDSVSFPAMPSRAPMM
jgi:hypothetical protein